MTSVIRSLL